MMVVVTFFFLFSFFLREGSVFSDMQEILGVSFTQCENRPGVLFARESLWGVTLVACSCGLVFGGTAEFIYPVKLLHHTFAHLAEFLEFSFGDKTVCVLSLIHI